MVLPYRICIDKGRGPALQMQFPFLYYIAGNLLRKACDVIGFAEC